MSERVKNAEQAFSAKRLSSHFSFSIKFSAFRFFYSLKLVFKKYTNSSSGGSAASIRLAYSTGPFIFIFFVIFYFYFCGKCNPHLILKRFNCRGLRMVCMAKISNELNIISTTGHRMSSWKRKFPLAYALL